MRRYMAVAMSYDDIAHHYGDVAIVGTNHDPDTTAQ